MRNVYTAFGGVIEACVDLPEFSSHAAMASLLLVLRPARSKASLGTYTLAAVTFAIAVKSYPQTEQCLVAHSADIHAACILWADEFTPQVCQFSWVLNSLEIFLQFKIKKQEIKDLF